MSSLDEIQSLLDEGMRHSKQTSLGRRMPASAAIPFLAKARTQLREFVVREKENARGWRMLSLAEETMLAYPRAIAALEQALALDDNRDKKDLKRLAALRAASAQWTDLALTPEQLADLGMALVARQTSGVTSVDVLEGTRTWLREQKFSAADIAKILKAMAVKGGTDDTGVLDNIVRGAAV
jgi:hypothetical protein